ncbi:MAG: SCO family protein [Chitinophagaceae bacterium]|nr:SCO family protein [Chitinophagaceae bacterium]
MRRKWIFYVGFFTLLVVGFYFTLAKIIPGYADRKFQFLNYVQPFAFTNQNGEQVTQQDVVGKVYVAEYFFTTCPSICPMMNNNMKKIYEEYKDEPDFLILSHTCDPENDNPGRLRQYSDSLNVNTKKWVFLTGRKDSLYNTARVSYLLDDPKNNAQNINEQFLHTQFFALVDKNGNVRKKIYDGLKKEEIQELKKDIAVLLREPSQKRFVNNVFSK